MEYRFCGESGLKLPVVSLGLWHNFRATDDYDNSRQMICHAFDKEMLELTQNVGSGFISFSLLAQGLLTNKYLKGITTNSRTAQENSFLKKEIITDNLLKQITNLEKLAKERGQSLTQMALAWTLLSTQMTSVIVGVRNTTQLEDNISIINHLNFDLEELEQIKNYT